MADPNDPLEQQINAAGHFAGKQAAQDAMARTAGTAPVDLPIGGDTERTGASAARNLGEPSTPGAGGGASPAPLRRFPQVMNDGAQGSPLVRRPINATPPSPSMPKTPPVQLAPTPGGGSRPVFNLPKGMGQVPATATMFLFLGLVAVVLWRSTIVPVWNRGLTGDKTPVTLPSSSMLSLLLFGVLLIFVSELGPTAASFTALLMLGLWAVFLIMNPGVVTTFASWVSQGNQQAGQAATAQQSQQAKQTGKKG